MNAAIKEAKELSMLSEGELEKTGRLWKSVCDESREQRKDIPIIEGHDPGDCFWIWPVKVHIDEGKIKQVEGLPDNISIQEEDFEEYLYPAFKKNFDEDLLYNRLRYDELDKRNITWFEWYLEYNFFTYQEIEEICKELLDRSDSLKGQEETKAIMITDFYRRFVSRVQFMMEKFPSADAISVMGP